MIEPPFLPSTGSGTNYDQVIHIRLCLFTIRASRMTFRKTLLVSLKVRVAFNGGMLEIIHPKIATSELARVQANLA
jgi:hypothetical protein